MNVEEFFCLLSAHYTDQCNQMQKHLQYLLLSGLMCIASNCTLVSVSAASKWVGGNNPSYAYRKYFTPKRTDTRPTKWKQTYNNKVYYFLDENVKVALKNGFHHEVESVFIEGISTYKEIQSGFRSYQRTNPKAKITIDLKTNDEDEFFESLKEQFKLIVLAEVFPNTMPSPLPHDLSSDKYGQGDAPAASPIVRKTHNYAPPYNLEDLVDRLGVFETIDDGLQAGKPFYIHTIGGLGKTEVALSFCSSEFVEKYDYVFWVDVTSQNQDVREDIMNLEFFSFKRDPESKNTSVVFRRFAIQFRELKGKVLLVVDNVTSTDQVQSIEHRDSVSLLYCDALITTRAIPNDDSYNGRVLDLKELEPGYCKTLFYRSFGKAEDDCGKDAKQLLNELLGMLKQHTYLIKLVAKVGYRGGYSLEELVFFVKERGLLHEKLQVEIPSDRHLNYENIKSVIQALFHHANLSSDEQSILAWFSLLPDRMIELPILKKWMSGGSLTEMRLINALHRLADNGWLFQKRIEDTKGTTFSYKCHELIQTAVRAQPELKDLDVSEYVQRMADFFYSTRDGRNYEEQRSLLPVAASVIEKYNPNSNVANEAIWWLKFHYARLSHRFFLNSKQAVTDTLPWLIANEERIFGDQVCWDEGDWSEKEKQVVRHLDLVQLKASFMYRYYDGASKYDDINRHRIEADSYSEKHLPKNHYVRLRALQLLAESYRNFQTPEKLEKAQEILQDLDERIRRVFKNETGISAVGKWQFLQERILLDFGLTYGALARNAERESDYALMEKYLLLACRARTEVHELRSVRAATSQELTLAYNDLGMNHLFLFDLYFETSGYCDAEKAREHLEKAECFLEESLRLRLELEDGKNRQATALAFSSRADLKLRQTKVIELLKEKQGKLDEANEDAKQSLSIRLKVIEDQNSLYLHNSYLCCARVCLAYYEQVKDATKKAEGLKYIDKAIKIVPHLHRGDESNPRYKVCYEVFEKLKEIPD